MFTKWKETKSKGYSFFLDRLTCSWYLWGMIQFFSSISPKCYKEGEADVTIYFSWLKKCWRVQTFFRSIVYPDPSRKVLPRKILLWLCTIIIIVIYHCLFNSFSRLMDMYHFVLPARLLINWICLETSNYDKVLPETFWIIICSLFKKKKITIQ